MKDLQTIVGLGVGVEPSRKRRIFIQPQDMDGGRKIYGHAKMKIKIALLRNLNPAPAVKTKLTQFGKNRQHFFWMSEASSQQCVQVKGPASGLKKK